jgi:cyclophilin family peptidyl-prolyl cis-trans isomerase
MLETQKQNITDALERAVIDGYLLSGGAPNLDGGYTVFGQMTEGFDVLQTIATLPIINDGRDGAPQTDVVISGITQTTYTAPAE